MITSRNNPQLKKVRALIEQGKERKKTGLFVIEGTRLVSEAQANLIESIYISESLKASEFDLFAELSERLDGDFAERETDNGKSIKELLEPKVEIVSDDVFKTLSDTVNPQGILAVVRQPSYNLDDLKNFSKYIILDDIRDPGNLGTIVRTSEAAGAAVIMSPNCADIFNPKVIRSTMGTIFRVPFLKCELVPAIEKLEADGTKVFAAALDGAVFYNEVKQAESNAIIIGNEANGISRDVLEAADCRIKIPMKGKVESLNAAISAAILMYYFE